MPNLLPGFGGVKGLDEVFDFFVVVVVDELLLGGFVDDHSVFPESDVGVILFFVGKGAMSTGDCISRLSETPASPC